MLGDRLARDGKVGRQLRRGGGPRSGGDGREHVARASRRRVRRAPFRRRPTRSCECGDADVTPQPRRGGGPAARRTGDARPRRVCVPRGSRADLHDAQPGVPVAVRPGGVRPTTARRSSLHQCHAICSPARTSVTRTSRIVPSSSTTRPRPPGRTSRSTVEPSQFASSSGSLMASQRPSSRRPVELDVCSNRASVLVHVCLHEKQPISCAFPKCTLE